MGIAHPPSLPTFIPSFNLDLSADRLRSDFWIPLASLNRFSKGAVVLEKDVNPELWDAGRWEESVRAVFRKSLEDPAFRKTAVADPRKAIEIATGRPAPENLKLRFVETLEEKTFVLPQSDAPASQLSEVDISRILYHCYRSQSMLPDPA